MSASPSPLTDAISPTPSTPFQQPLNLSGQLSSKRLRSFFDPFDGEDQPGPTRRVKKPTKSIAFLASPPQHQENLQNSARIPPHQAYFSPGRDFISRRSGPKSTSFQANGVFDFKSPLSQRLSIHSGGKIEQGNEKSKFNWEFYKRIDEFLEAEGLFLIDPCDFLRGSIPQRRRQKSRAQYLDITEEDREEPSQIELRSASCQPPELFIQNIKSSMLFQRRVLSQAPAPIKALLIPTDCFSPFGKTRGSRLSSSIKMGETERCTPLSSKSGGGLKSSLIFTPKTSKRNYSPMKRINLNKAVSKGCSPELPDELKNIPTLKGAHSLHEKAQQGEWLF